MAKTQNIEVKIKAILDAGPSVAGLKELKKLQREVGSGTNEFKMAQQGMADFSDSIKTAKGQSQDLVDSLASTPGPIGMLARGFDQMSSSTNKFGLALKATGIGLLVALVGQLVMAFTSNEKAMKKLEPVMIGFEKILGGIFAALEPVFDIFVELAVSAIPYLTKGIGILYSTLFGLVTFIKDAVVGAGKLLIGVFTLDTDMISEGMDQLTGSITSGVDAGLAAYGRFDEGTKETTKTQKKNLDEQNANHQKFLEKQKALFAAEEKERQANLDKQKAIAMAGAKTEEERLMIEKKYALDVFNSKKKLLEDQAKLYPKASAEYKDLQTQLIALDTDYLNKKTEFTNKEKELRQKDFDDKLKKQIEGDKLIVDQLRANLDEAKLLYKENSVVVRAVQDEIFSAQQQGLNNERALLEGKAELTDAERTRLNQIVLDQQNLTTTIKAENKKRFDSDLDTALKTAEVNKKATDDLFAENMRKNEGDLIAQQELLNEKKLLDEQYYTEQLAREGLNAEQIKAIKDKQLADSKANAEAQITIEQKKFDAQQKLLQAISNALMAAADIAGKNTVAGKALAIAATSINTFSAIAAQLAAFGKVPIPGYAIVQAVATGLVGFKAVSDIIKTKVPSTSGGGGGASSTGTAVPTPRGLASGGMVSGPGGGKSDLIPAMLSNGESVINAESTSMFRPLLSSINAIGGGRRFAEGGLAVSGMGQDQALQQLQTMMTTQQAPIRTYVVASDMSNQQMLDRNIKDRSTL